MAKDSNIKKTVVSKELKKLLDEVNEKKFVEYSTYYEYNLPCGLSLKL